MVQPIRMVSSQQPCVRLACMTQPGEDDALAGVVSNNPSPEQQRIYQERKERICAELRKFKHSPHPVGPLMPVVCTIIIGEKDRNQDDY